METLWKEGKISPAKYHKLQMPLADLPEGFLERDLRNSQYIARKAQEMLRKVVREVTPTIGGITDRLREDWQLVHVLRELNWGKYHALGLTGYERNKNGDKVPVIKDWTKRNDHRHHAMDALTVAFTRRSHVQYFNYLNARRNENHRQHAVIANIEGKETYVNDKGRRLIKPPLPPEVLRAEAKKHLHNTLVSFKTSSRVTTRSKNRTKSRHGERVTTESTPRGQLHKETVYGAAAHYVCKPVKVGPKFDRNMIMKVAKPSHRKALLARFEAFGGDPKKAFGGKNAPAKTPVWLNARCTKALPEKVKLTELVTRYTARKAVAPDLKIDKVIDARVRQKLQERLNAFGGKPKEAFANLDENPIWLDEAARIPIKRVTVTGPSKVEPLHTKKDHLGRELTDEAGNPLPADYVNTGNNHHIAIYEDEDGNLHEAVVSFMEAVARANAGTPVVSRHHPDRAEWQFRFTLKRNEYFVFPNEQTDFDPTLTDLQDEQNYHLVSPHLFRVQKIAPKNYVFRHHLETTVTDERKETRNITWKLLSKCNDMQGAVKVRIDRLGRIVQVGEF